MAKANNGFLGDAVNKLGNVVFSRLNGKSIVKKYQPNVKNTNSPGQQITRNHLKNLSAYLKQLNSSFIPILYHSSGLYSSIFAQSIKDNKNLVDNQGELNLEFLRLGVPDLPSGTVKNCVYNAFIDQLTLNFNLPSAAAINEFTSAFCSVVLVKNNGYCTVQFDTRHLLCDMFKLTWHCYVSSYPEAEPPGTVFVHITDRYDNTIKNGALFIQFDRRFIKPI